RVSLLTVRAGKIVPERCQPARTGVERPVHVPDERRRVPAGGNEQPATRTEGQTADELNMSLQAAPYGAAGQLAHDDGVIGATAGQQPAVGRQRVAHPDVGMTAERVPELPGRGIPDPQGPALAPVSNDTAAVGCELNVLRVLRSHEGVFPFARCHVPEGDLLA